MTVRERTPLLRLPDDADDFEHGRPYSYRTCVARDGKPCADCLEAHNRYRHPNGTNPGRSAGVDDFDYAGARRRRLAILRVVDGEAGDDELDPADRAEPCPSGKRPKVRPVVVAAAGGDRVVDPQQPTNIEPVAGWIDASDWVEAAYGD
jgi:hypothetical protein